MEQKDKLILKAVVVHNDRKTISCTQALQISKECCIPLKEIADACDRYGIKITNCEPGCFR